MSALQNNDDLSKIHLLGSVPLVSHWSKIALSLASRNANNDETEDLALIWDFDTLSSGRATCPTVVYTQKTDTTLEQQTTSLFPRIAPNAEARFWRWSWLCANCHGFPVNPIIHSKPLDIQTHLLWILKHQELTKSTIDYVYMYNKSYSSLCTNELTKTVEQCRPSISVFARLRAGGESKPVLRCQWVNSIFWCHLVAQYKEGSQKMQNCMCTHNIYSK